MLRLFPKYQLLTMPVAFNCADNLGKELEDGDNKGYDGDY